MEVKSELLRPGIIELAAVADRSETLCDRVADDSNVHNLSIRVPESCEPGGQSGIRQIDKRRSRGSNSEQLRWAERSFLHAGRNSIRLRSCRRARRVEVRCRTCTRGSKSKVRSNAGGIGGVLAQVICRVSRRETEWRLL